jgi:tetratricopeptide (TPR) repeat protein
MMDNLQEAYQAYQQALYHLQNPKDPKLWYGIGILYDRYGSIEHAEEAFSAVLKMDPNFEKANEIYFRLGIIYKQQQKYDLSIQVSKITFKVHHDSYLSSAFVISCVIHQSHSQRSTFGSKLDMSMNNKKNMTWLKKRMKEY